MWAAALTGNTKHWHVPAFQDWQASLVEAKAVDDALERTKKLIQEMSWNKLLKNGIVVGAILVILAGYVLPIFPGKHWGYNQLNRCYYSW